jgi:hypothetical protein
LRLLCGGSRRLALADELTLRIRRKLLNEVSQAGNESDGVLVITFEL